MTSPPPPQHRAFVGYPEPRVWQCDCGSHGTGGPKGLGSHLFWARRRGEAAVIVAAPTENKHTITIEELATELQKMGRKPTVVRWHCSCGGLGPSLPLSASGSLIRAMAGAMRHVGSIAPWVSKDATPP
jgi:hypothetical protein